MARKGIRPTDVRPHDERGRVLPMRVGRVIDRPRRHFRTVLIRDGVGFIKIEIDVRRACSVRAGIKKVVIDRRKRVKRQVGWGSKVLVAKPVEGEVCDTWAWASEVKQITTLFKAVGKLNSQEADSWPEPYQEGGPIVLWNPDGVVTVWPVA